LTLTSALSPLAAFAYLAMREPHLPVRPDPFVVSSPHVTVRILDMTSASAGGDESAAAGGGDASTRVSAHFRSFSSPT